MLYRSLKNLFLLVTLVAVVAGSSGISILIHDCSGSRKTDYVAFPALQESKAGSCCKESCSLPKETPQKETSVKKAKCCKSSKITLKVNPYERQYITQASVLISPEMVVNHSISSIFEEDDTLVLASNSPPEPATFKPSGKDLICLIQQLRISSDC